MDTPAWTCHVCGTEGITAEKCPVCDAPRTVTIRPVTPPGVLLPRPHGDNLFIFRPEHEKFVQGRTHRLTGRTLGYVIAGLALCLACIVLGFAGRVLPAWLEARELENEGVITTGVIQDVRVVENDEGAHGYFVTYQFSDDGQLYSREQRVSRDNFLAWIPGAEVQVKYAPSEPQHSKLVGDDTQDRGRQWEIVGVIGAAAVLLGALIVVGNYRLRVARLEREGRLLPGEVLMCGSGMDDSGNLTVSVKYVFETPQGDEVIKYESRVANDLKGKPLPMPGVSILVLYVAPDNFRLM